MTAAVQIGNAHLKWAFSEAAVGFLQKNPRGQKLIHRLRSKHGKGKALSILADASAVPPTTCSAAPPRSPWSAS